MNAATAPAAAPVAANTTASLPPTNGSSLPSASTAQPATSLSSSAAPSAPSSIPAPTARLQLIDEDQKFTPQLNDRLSQWGLQDAGFGYDLCAVLGSQSTGKSTLLNKLFGTTFDVMDETRRQQTTKGIWMCRGQAMNVLVMDVEGTDGRERGEDQDFERKSALFSMASAECLIVNMWEHQVGLYQGANMALLKTVFEVNLGLFQAAKGSSASKDKTLLCFVIRDHIGNTPLENLQNTILADLRRIWDSLSKPEGLEQSTIDTFFDFTFVTLPHKILQPAEFDAQVNQLRARFVDSSRKDFIFKPEYHKRIPADGLPHYLGSIWEQVQTNKDLDLPTQQELLAQFRCDEIAAAAFTVFALAVKVFRRPIEQGEVLADLGVLMGKHRGVAVAEFDKAASRYHADVYRRKRSDLLEKLNSTLSPFYLGQLKNLHKSILAAFKASVLDKLRGEGYDFASVVSTERERALTTFEKNADHMCLDETDWSYEDELDQLRVNITEIADQCRREETKKMVLQIERNVKRDLAEPTELALSRPQPDMWDRILSNFSATLDKAEVAYLRKAKSFSCTDEENEKALRTLKRRSWLVLRAKIDEQTADSVLITKLRGAFEDRFRYDEAGVPRVWRPEDDIDGLFRVARDETLALIPLYSRIAPQDSSKAVELPSTSDDPESAHAVARGEEEDFDFPASLVVFSETRKAELGARFRKEADAYYVEAKRSTVSTMAQIPLWIYGVIAVLGFNEFVAVISSPVYFTFLLLAGTTVYLIWYLGMSGPVLSVGKAMGREVHRVADEKLRQHFAQPVPMPAVLAEGGKRAPSVAMGAPSRGSGASSEQKGEEIELKERRPATDTTTATAGGALDN
ncbi:root hair defective 3 GTP-binding protein [Jaminaea rosea]|uniref:Root hair defective 3 GTP-binding protein n=1 Tax=Jaminaea rosea TaxID=1569628 RepID=A0A316UNP8_9BASI|nr:root hair defective 3 GTP-binding protein [Jaminaea rosea]PWN26932.1 root hair defective 3 GTP-binding protein [Jaminaea rosea]